MFENEQTESRKPKIPKNFYFQIPNKPTIAQI